MKTRTEKDSMGRIEVPSDALYGSFTQRASQNFQLNKEKSHRIFIRSLGIVKKAAALANMKTGSLDKKLGDAIVYASDLVIEGKVDPDFPLNYFQAGAGTPFNMNANEVIANIANKKLGGNLGEYKLVHPNNHVNMSQSSNNFTPTVIRVACLLLLNDFNKELEKLEESLKAKAWQYKDVLKIGRTHLEDAVPITFAQVFNAYAASLKKSQQKVKQAAGWLLEVGLGGTAIGTGINTHPDFNKEATKALSSLTGFNFVTTSDNVELTWSMSAFLGFSQSLALLATELNKIANDLRLLNSGPHAGIGEIILEEVEPGSSIMPGKVNPSIPEAVNMVCFQVLGNNHAIEAAANAGQLELNVMTPVIAYNLIFSLELLTNSFKMFRALCIDTLSMNKIRASELLGKSLSLATALNPYIGYEVAAQIVNITLKEGKTLKEVVLENKILSAEALGKILDAKKMTMPSVVDKRLAAEVKNSEGYKKFREKVLG